MTLQIECLWQRWPWLFLAAALIYLSLCILKEPDYVPLRKRRILFFLRIAPVFMFLLVVFSPVLVIKRNVVKKPEYVVLVDGSSSMAVGNPVSAVDKHDFKE